MEYLEKEGSTGITNRHRKKSGWKTKNGWGGGYERNHNRRHTATAEKDEVQSKDNEQQSGHLQHVWRQLREEKLIGSKEDIDNCIINDPRITFKNRTNSNNTHSQYSMISIWPETAMAPFSWVNVSAEIYAEVWSLFSTKTLGIHVLYLHKYTGDWI